MLDYIFDDDQDEIRRLARAEHARLAYDREAIKAAKRRARVAVRVQLCINQLAEDGFRSGLLDGVTADHDDLRLVLGYAARGVVGELRKWIEIDRMANEAAGETHHGPQERANDGEGHLRHDDRQFDR